ncbi:hypothetical protein F2P56_027961 [Juglans regia]|uniref:Transmembrane protein n=2 Tax=Juglans regia TaxID=51240 RepID=A0A833UJF9_JUGRE|nr:uncharacterized protein LOC109007919 [Juglans regia]KAF5453014.1 hypothetical protein F2P56_027961 [Juglans regia]
MSEAPKLYTNKPKKAQLKQFQEQQQKAQEFPSSSSSSSMGPQSSAPPPQQPPKESFARRYKFVWPMLLAVNVAVGAYFVTRTKKKQTDVEEEVAATPVSTKAATTTLVPEKPLPFPTITEAVKSREPIPEDQQRELFKWLLEEKRKIKTKDPEEKKRIDEEKAILKQFIRAKSIPSI